MHERKLSLRLCEWPNVRLWLAPLDLFLYIGFSLEAGLPNKVSTKRKPRNMMYVSITEVQRPSFWPYSSLLCTDRLTCHLILLCLSLLDHSAPKPVVMQYNTPLLTQRIYRWSAFTLLLNINLPHCQGNFYVLA